MTPELQKYYDDRFTMMSTQGWVDLVEDVQVMFDSYNKVTTVDSVEELHKRKGQLDILQWILTLKAVSEAAFEELENE